MQDLRKIISCGFLLSLFFLFFVCLFSLTCTPNNRQGIQSLPVVRGHRWPFNGWFQAVTEIIYILNIPTNIILIVNQCKTDQEIDGEEVWLRRSGHCLQAPQPSGITLVMESACQLRGTEPKYAEEQHKEIHPRNPGPGKGEKRKAKAAVVQVQTRTTWAETQVGTENVTVANWCKTKTRFTRNLKYEKSIQSK